MVFCFFRGGRAGDSSTDDRGEPDVDDGDGKNIRMVDCLFPGVGNKFIGTNADATDAFDAND